MWHFSENKDEEVVNRLNICGKFVWYLSENKDEEVVNALNIFFYLPSTSAKQSIEYKI